jgi:hypothetical protein
VTANEIGGTRLSDCSPCGSSDAGYVRFLCDIAYSRSRRSTQEAAACFNTCCAFDCGPDSIEFLRVFITIYLPTTTASLTLAGYAVARVAENQGITRCKHGLRFKDCLYVRGM